MRNEKGFFKHRLSKGIQVLKLKTLLERHRQKKLKIRLDGGLIRQFYRCPSLVSVQHVDEIKTECLFADDHI